MFVDLKKVNLFKLYFVECFENVSDESTIKINKPRNQIKFTKNFDNLSFLILILFSLIHSCQCVSLTNKINDENSSEQKDFKVAFNKFIDDWKSKNPKFNFTTVNLPENLLFNLNNDLRKKRDISLEEELEYVLKNKNPKNLYNFERKSKSVEQNSNEFNSLEDRSLEQFKPEETCVNCKSHDFLKKQRLEQIKEEILRKLKLDKPPTVNLSSINRQLILKSFQKNDPNFQNDQDSNDFINDDEDVRIKQIITFSKKAPKYLKLEDYVLYFPLSKHIYNTEVLESELTFNIFTTPEFNSLNNTAYVKIYRVERTEKGEDVDFLVAEKTLNVIGTSAWVTVEINDLVNFWASNRNKNFGLVIHCYNSLSKKFALNLNEESIFIKTSHKSSKRTKVKREVNDCSKDSNTSMCCRWPLEVNFSEIGFDFILGPESYNAFYCGGKCKLGNTKLLHSSIMYHSNKSSSVCCHGQKYSGISIIYLENNQAVYMELKDMVVDRCSCS